MIRGVFLVLISILATLPGCRKKSEKKGQTPSFRGQSIMVIVPKLHADLIRGPILKQAKRFNQQTGAKIRVVTPGWNETIEKINQSLTDSSLHYDIFVVIAMWNGTLLGGNHIEPIPDWVKKKIDWQDVLPIYKNNVLSWNNIAYGLPYDGDCINLYYRRDIFANQSYQQRFQKQFGYKLQPPKTWQQYRDIAQFFHGWDWDKDGKKNYGIAELRIKGDVAMLQFFARAAAYGKHPQDRAYFFDPDTMKPRIHTPPFARALQEYIEIMKYGPPNISKFAGHDVRNAFVTGKVIMAIDWADLGIYAVNNPASTVHDKVGYSQLPGTNQVYYSPAKQWQTKFNQVSSISGNWMFFINKNSKNKKLAFSFAAHMTSPQLTKELVATSGNAVNPSRYSHFKDPSHWQKNGFSTDSASRYLKEITKSLANTNVVYDITIPGAGDYYHTLDEAVYSAIEGKMSAQVALEQAADKWQKITDKLGRDRQIQFYRSSLNLGQNE